MKHLNTPFYLTGGTALSRCFFQHRYSDDLDFFVNADKEYSKHVKKIIHALLDQQSKGKFTIDTDSIIAEEYYSRIVVARRIDGNNCFLKIDMINDVAEFFGDVQTIAPFGRVDNVLNMLSNKLTALFRFEPKDIADIWIISKQMHFHWKELIHWAKQKELGLDVLKVSEIIKSFPPDYIDAVKWAIPIDKENMAEELGIIAEEILWGRENTLVSQV